MRQRNWSTSVIAGERTDDLALALELEGLGPLLTAMVELEDRQAVMVDAYVDELSGDAGTFSALAA